MTTGQSGTKVQICQEDSSCSGFGSQGSSVGQFDEPRGVVIDSLGRIVIAERGNDRLQFCDYQGNCEAFGIFGSGPGTQPGQFWEPASIDVDGEGGLYVGETGDEVISICSEAMACSARMGIEGDGVGEFKTPIAVQVTSRGDLLILELSNNRLQLCDLGGSCIAYGSMGRGNGQFRSPGEMVLSDDDRIYVADTDNHRIQVIQLTYNSDPPGPEPTFLINPGLNDAWFNPLTAGQGLLITVFPGIRQVFMAWFTYDVERPPADVTAMLGEPGHRWLTAQGPYEGDTANLTISMTEGGIFDSAVPVPTTDPANYGSITLEFADCTAGVLTYNMPSLGLNGEIPLERITGDNVALCESLGSP